MHNWLNGAMLAMYTPFGMCGDSAVESTRLVQNLWSKWASDHPIFPAQFKNASCKLLCDIAMSAEPRRKALLSADMSYVFQMMDWQQWN